MKNKINESELRQILNSAKFAPSSHNTQPWQAIGKGSKLSIGYDSARHLKIGDPDKRELYMSLGCFTETVILAAQDFGYKVSYTFNGTEDSGSVIELSFNKAGVRNTKWSDLIKRRRSDRRMYQEKKLNPPQVNQLAKLKQGLASLVIIENKESIEFLAVMTRDATYEIMSEQEFRNELADWVRNNWTKKPDGMPGYTQGMPGPVSLLAKFVIRKTKRVASDQAKKDSKRVLHSSSIGLICVSENTEKAWIDAGRLYQRTCLSALDFEIKSSAVSAAVISTKTNGLIRTRLKLNELPVALIRFGYTKGSVKSTPRRSVNDYYKQVRVPS